MIYDLNMNVIDTQQRYNICKNLFIFKNTSGINTVEAALASNSAKMLDWALNICINRLNLNVNDLIFATNGKLAKGENFDKASPPGACRRCDH